MKSMPLKTTLHRSLAAVAGPLLFLAGCSVLKPKADLTQFYVLRSGSTGSQAEARASTVPTEIRIGPGRLANYLEATPIAVQDGDNRLFFDPVAYFHQDLVHGPLDAGGDDSGAASDQSAENRHRLVEGL